MTPFQKKWFTAKEKHNSVVVAACDPAIHARKDGDTIPGDVSLYDWCMRYVTAVAPHVAGFKCNPAYYQSEEGMRTLSAIADFARMHGHISLIDAKVSDIGSTNDAWFAGYAALGFDAVTVAPYAGNIESSIADAHARGLGAITMGFMSNPEYVSEANFKDSDTSLITSRVVRSVNAGADGIVVGATKNPHDALLQEVLERTWKTGTLYLVPGIGAQGGTVANVYASGIDAERVMLTAARSLMFPRGQHSSPEDQKYAAAQLQKESYK